VKTGLFFRLACAQDPFYGIDGDAILRHELAAFNAALEPLFLFDSIKHGRLFIILDSSGGCYEKKKPFGCCGVFFGVFVTNINISNHRTRNNHNG
jgi:hypothetical protein